MKKILTASLVAMMAVTAANADIASTKYVNTQSGLPETRKTFIAGDFKGAAADKTNLKDAVNAIADSISDGTAFGAGSVNGNVLIDKTVAKGKLADDVQASLGLADTALQQSAIDALDVTDAAVEKQFVTAVSEADGKVTVSRAALKATDIPTIEQSQVNGLGTALGAKQDTIADLDAIRSGAEAGATALQEADLADYAKTADVVTNDEMEAFETANDQAIATAKSEAIADAQGKIEALDVTDTAVEKQFVTAVSEVDGKVTVSRAALVATDIPTIEQSQVNGLGTALGAKQDTITDLDAIRSGAQAGATALQEADLADYAKTADVVTNDEMEAFETANDQAIATAKSEAIADAQGKIEALDVTDTAVEKQFVTAVSEADGKVTVSRAALQATDIPTIEQSQVNGLGTALGAKQDTITDLDDIRSGAEAGAAAMNWASIKDATWTAAGCGGDGVVCSLVSKGGNIGWEKVVD